MDTLLILLGLINLMLLSSSRLRACIRFVAFQGILLGGLTLSGQKDLLNIHGLILAFGIVLLKGMVLPWLLSKTLLQSDVRREIEPFVGYISSLLIGIVILAICFRISTHLPIPVAVSSPMILPIALFTIMTGLFLIISRKKALSQVLGYLVLENGIYAFGAVLMEQASLFVELGILLDVFVAVFVMGIIIFHINREFDHIDTDRLSNLKDWS